MRNNSLTDDNTPLAELVTSKPPTSITTSTSASGASVGKPHSTGPSDSSPEPKVVARPVGRPRNDRLPKANIRRKIRRNRRPRRTVNTTSTQSSVINFTELTLPEKVSMQECSVKLETLPPTIDEDDNAPLRPLSVEPSLIITAPIATSSTDDNHIEEESSAAAKRPPPMSFVALFKRGRGRPPNSLKHAITRTSKSKYKLQKGKKEKKENMERLSNNDKLRKRGRPKKIEINPATAVGGGDKPLDIPEPARESESPKTLPPREEPISPPQLSPDSTVAPTTIPRPMFEYKTPTSYSVLAAGPDINTEPEVVISMDRLFKKSGKAGSFFKRRPHHRKHHIITPAVSTTSDTYTSTATMIIHSKLYIYIYIYLVNKI